MKLAPLYYASDRGWVEIPEWGTFFLHLGCTLALRSTYEHRSVIGLALPTGAYSASLIATGIVAGRAQMRRGGTDSMEHFRQLCTLEPGTALYYRRTRTNFVKVCFIGYEELAGEPKIRIDDGKYQYVLSPQLAQKVEVAPRSLHKSPQASRRRTLESFSPFFSCFFAPEAEAEHTFRSCLDCAIIGPTGRIKEEITTANFGVLSTEGNMVKGSLQDLLRVQRFSRTGQVYRSALYSLHGQEKGGSVEQMTSFVLFNGASSFLTCRDRWRLSHWMVLLDYTDARFHEALDAFNEEYIKYHIHPEKIDDSLDVPVAVTIAAFQEPWI